MNGAYYLNLYTSPGAYNDTIADILFFFSFNNISAISWWSVLLVEYPEKTIDLSQVTDKLSHNVDSSTPRLNGIRTHNVSGDRH